MQWELKLSPCIGDRRIINAVLGVLGLTTTETEYSLLVSGAALDAMAEGEVRPFGTRLAHRLSTLCAHDPKLEFDVQLDSVIQHGGGTMYGVLTTTVHATGILSTSQFGMATVRSESPEQRTAREAEEERLEYERCERLAIALVVPPVRLTAAATVERLLLLEQLPNTLYNIMEVIEGEGSVPLSDLASSNRWELFRRSMCHPAAVGDNARHVANTNQPPANPMRLREAREFIASVALTWLEKLAGLRP